jgi:hypothetical protein
MHPFVAATGDSSSGGLVVRPVAWLSSTSRPTAPFSAGRVAPNRGGNLAVVRTPSRMRTCRQLKHRATLTGAQAGQEDHLAARKFERVVMLVGIISAQWAVRGGG